MAVRQHVWPGLARNAATWLLPLGAFVAALVTGWPALPAGPALSHVLVLAALAGGALAAWRWEGPAGRAVVLTLVAVLFAMPLNGAWTSGISTGSFVGGLIPLSDAAGYTHDARGLLAGQHLSAFSSRRPLFAALLSTLLWATGGSLQASLALLVLGTAATAFVLGREIRSTHGPLAAVATVALLLAFYRRFAPTLLTEQLGLPLGALALAWLWRASTSGSRSRAWVGLGLLALALNARAGAFFVLPALLVWVAIVAAPGVRARVRAVVIGALAIVLAFAASLALVRLVGSPNVPFGNYALPLYGLAAGGKGWQQVQADHPELRAMAEDERNRRVLALALERIRQRPADLAIGCARSLRDLASLGSTGIACFLPGGRAGLAARVIFVVAVLAGLARCWHERRQAWARLLLLGAAGILASVPLVPPADADEMRAYAATFPIVAAVAAVGGAFAASWAAARLRPGLRPASPAGTASGEPRSTLGPALALAYLVVAVAIPPALRAAGSRPRCGESTCPAPQVGACLQRFPGSAVHLVADGDARHSSRGRVRIGEFQRGLAYVPDRSLAAVLAVLEPGTTLLGGQDPTRPEVALVVIPKVVRLAAGEASRVCGSLLATEGYPSYSLMYVQPPSRPAVD